MDDLSKKAKEVEPLVRTLAKQLVGKDVDVQGAALADLLAMWLAGHINTDNPDDSDAIRETMLEMHLVAVKALVPINYEMKVKPLLKRMRR